MKKKVLRLAVVFASAMPFMAFSELTVTDVTAKQRYPWNGLVDITCNVSGINGTSNRRKFALEVVDTDSGTTNKVSLFWILQNGTNSTDHTVYTNGEYRLVWDARSDFGQVIYNNMVMRVSVFDVHGKVQLWEGGPFWAETNIGAEEPWDCGFYFWWGDTVGYKWENNEWVASDGLPLSFSFDSEDIPTYQKDISTLLSQGWINTDGVLATDHDAAQVQWGGRWRMPTYLELIALNNMCEWIWTTTNGVNGFVVCGKGEYSDAKIFLPASGYGAPTSLGNVGSDSDYWSSVPYADNKLSAYNLYIHQNDHYTGRISRRRGRSIRPVQGFGETAALTVTDVFIGESAPFLLDTKITSTSPVVDVISVSWDAAWIGGDAGATIVIADNGVEVKRATGMGEFMYVLSSAGQHELTYTTYIGGVAQDEVYTATVYKGNTITVTNFVEVVVTNTVTDHITVTNTVTDHVTVTNTVTDHVTVTNTVTDHVTLTNIVTQTVTDTITDYVTVTNTVIETNLVDVVITNTVESVVTNTVTDYLTLTNIVTQTVTDTITDYVTVTNTVVETNLVDVVMTNTVESVVTNTVTDYLTLTNIVTQTVTDTITDYMTVTNTVVETNLVDVVITNTVESVVTNTVTDYLTLTNIIEIAEEPVIVPEPVQTFEPTGDFTGESKSKKNGIIFDADGTMRGMIQIETAKATLRGVKVKGFVMMEDGKKVAIKQVTVPIIQWLFYRRLNIETTVGKIGKLSLMFGGDGFKGTLGEMKVVSADIGKDAGVLSGSLTLKYIDAKGKVVNQKIAVGGVATGGTAAGTVTPKGGKAKVFAAEFE